MEALNGQTLPNSSESLNVKVAEDPSKMNNTFFAGVQTGKNMMMANAYAAYGGYETGSRLMLYVKSHFCSCSS